MSFDGFQIQSKLKLNYEPSSRLNAGVVGVIVTVGIKCAMENPTDVCQYAPHAAEGMGGQANTSHSMKYDLAPMDLVLESELHERMVYVTVAGLDSEDHWLGDLTYELHVQERYPSPIALFAVNNSIRMANCKRSVSGTTYTNVLATTTTIHSSNHDSSGFSTGVGSSITELEVDSIVTNNIQTLWFNVRTCGYNTLYFIGIGSLGLNFVLSNFNDTDGVEVIDSGEIDDDPNTSWYITFYCRKTTDIPLLSVDQTTDGFLVEYPFLLSTVTYGSPVEHNTSVAKVRNLNKHQLAMLPPTCILPATTSHSDTSDNRPQHQAFRHTEATKTTYSK